MSSYLRKLTNSLDGTEARRKKGKLMRIDKKIRQQYSLMPIQTKEADFVSDPETTKIVQGVGTIDTDTGVITIPQPTTDPVIVEAKEAK